MSRTLRDRGRRDRMDGGECKEAADAQRALIVAVVGAVLLTLVLGLLRRRTSEATTLTVMSFNIWGGGANEDKPIDETVAAIEAVDPDIVGIQETQLEGPKCTANVLPAAGQQRRPGARRRARLRALRAEAGQTTRCGRTRS